MVLINLWSIRRMWRTPLLAVWTCQLIWCNCNPADYPQIFCICVFWVIMLRPSYFLSWTVQMRLRGLIPVPRWLLDATKGRCSSSPALCGTEGSGPGSENLQNRVAPTPACENLFVKRATTKGSGSKFMCVFVCECYSCKECDARLRKWIISALFDQIWDVGWLEIQEKNLGKFRQKME